MTPATGSVLGTGATPVEAERSNVGSEPSTVDVEQRATDDGMVAVSLHVGLSASVSAASHTTSLP